MKSSHHRLTRRRFLFATSMMAGGWIAGTRAVVPLAGAENLSPNDRPGVALIGCGGRGRSVAKACRAFGEVLAVCDVDAGRLQQAKEEFPGSTGYRDFRDVLDRKDLHAVICGTQDHWHALISIAAMRAGLDVYCEKPLTLTIEEGQHMVRVARETGRIVQTGSQQRSDGRFRTACELVRNGRVGRLHTITTLLPRGRRDGPFFQAEIPDGLDWDLWLGPRSMTPYLEEKCHGTFRYWYDYSGGTMTDWGAHHNDIALWAMGLDRSGPVEIEGRALVEGIPGGYTAASEFVVYYRYENGVRHICRSSVPEDNQESMSGLLPEFPQNGVLFEGTDGWILVNRQKIMADRPERISEPLPDSAEKLYVSGNHQKNFFDCMRSRKQPVCDVEIGHRSASVCHLGVIAIRTGRKIQWDPYREVILHDRVLNDWLQRPNRAPWDFKTI